MVICPPKDQRGFFMLPQGYEGGGYYVYGTPENGAGQYAHPDMMSLIMAVAARWDHEDIRKFGIGNLSLADGAKFPRHDTHRSGLEVDIRTIRKDGRQLPCNRYDDQYDLEATRRLITLFIMSGRIKTILFNDLRIPEVTYFSNHDDHFHLTLLSRTKK